jgi:hypothetical protein
MCKGSPEWTYSGTTFKTELHRAGPGVGGGGGDWLAVAGKITAMPSRAPGTRQVSNRRLMRCSAGKDKQGRSVRRLARARKSCNARES